MTLSPKGAERVTMFIIAAGMSLLMSAVMLLYNVGVTPDFWFAWMENWLVSVAVAYPAVLMIVPVAREITCRFTR